jgi:serine beta-lactamase-like protein LACTB
MKKVFICLIVALVCLLCYFLFEPIFLYNFGWEPLKVNKEAKTDIIYDSAYIDIIEKAQQFLDDSIELSTPSISIAVGINGSMVWAATRGYANAKASIEAAPNTSYRIGSTSKAVTSIGLGILLEQGRLRLDDTVASDIIDHNITIKQLASHTSGIRNYGLCLCLPIWEYFNNDEYASVQEAVAIFSKDQLLFEPGTDFSYSSYNFTALSAAMEEAAGVEFTRFMQQMVFRKAKMDNTAFDQQDILPKRAEFYDMQVKLYKNAYAVNNSNKWAGGGVLSTPTDLVKLGNVVLAGSIIKEKTFEMLTTPVKLASGEVNEQNYALGWRASNFDSPGLNKSVRIMHHGGTATGSTALWIIIPEYNLTAAVMINRSVESFPLFDMLIPIAEYFALYHSMEPQDKI